MFDYVTVPAGAPASTQGLADHLMGRTLGPDTGRALERMTGIGTVEVRPDLHPMVAEALGINLGRPLDAQEVSALFAGRRADGRPIEGKRRIAGQVGSVDVTMTADKSVSVAWAFARSVEQAAIYQAHRSASEAALRALVGRIGVARRGQGGMGGAEPGHVAWLSFDHFTARPTWDGELVAGDPNLHTHHTIMNAVFTGSHVGSMSLRDMEAMKKEIGALYHAFLAQNLRRLGAQVALDPETGAAVLPAVPEPVRRTFSKKTVDGEALAREHALQEGISWDEMSRGQKAAFMKTAVQGAIGKGADLAVARLLRRDDVARLDEWRHQAEEIGYRQEDILTPSRPIEPAYDRLEMAQDVAGAWVERHASAYAAPREWDYRIAAARGLIACGIESATDVDLVTARLTPIAAAHSIVEVTADQAHRQNLERRDEKRRAGGLGPDIVQAKTTGNQTLALAVGDRLMLHGRVRGAVGRGGSFGGSGTVVTVAGIDAPSGATLRRDDGREAFIPWRNLLDSEGALKLSYGDVVPVRGSQVPEDPATAFLGQAAALARGAAGYQQRGLMALERDPETHLHERAQQRSEGAALVGLPIGDLGKAQRDFLDRLGGLATAIREKIRVVKPRRPSQAERDAARERSRAKAPMSRQQRAAQAEPSRSIDVSRDR